NPIDIEGHTDGRPFKSAAASYDNWNLATDRANAARRVLEAAGMKKEQIARVVGYADQRPKTPEDLLNPANRRITISMRFTEQAQAALADAQAYETRPRRISAAEEAAAQETLEQASPPAAQSAPKAPEKIRDLETKKT